MRTVTVVCACLLTACSTQAVRCERHLTPINVPKRPIGEIIAPPQAQVASARSKKGGAIESDGAERPKTSGSNPKPSTSTPAAGRAGTP